MSTLCVFLVVSEEVFNILFLLPNILKIILQELLCKICSCVLGRGTPVLWQLGSAICGISLNLFK